MVERARGGRLDPVDLGPDVGEIAGEIAEGPLDQLLLLAGVPVVVHFFQSSKRLFIEATMV